jgi:hypothetical protein
MKKIAALTLSMFLISGPILADTPKDSDAEPAKAGHPTKMKADKKAENSESAIAAKLEEVLQTLQSQQEQLTLLKEELAKRDRQIDEAREAAAAANARAAEASTKATEAVRTTATVKSTADTLNTTVADLKISNEVLTTTVATRQPETSKASDEGPATIRYKGVNITPGGFVAAETVFRSRAEEADINTQFTGIPYPGNALSKVSENSFSARQSRLTMLVDSKVGSAKVSGYYEGDFLGAGTTSNNRQTNSYVFRQRQIWAQAALENGWSFTGGQMWTMATENKKGIQNLREDLPMMIDPNYVVGFTWARQYGFRVVKDFGGKFALGISVEGPQATIGGRGFSLVTTTTVGSASVATTGNTFVDAPGNSGGLFNAFDPTGYSVNKAPDLMVKATTDPKFGHFELFGIVSTFRNRDYPCGVVGTNSTDTAPPATPTTLFCGFDPTNKKPAPSALGAFNDSRIGGGIGASALISVAKKVDFGLKAVAGDGIGRYGSAQIADLTFRPDGTQALIRTAHGLARVEVHVTPKLDLYAYYGGEYGWRAGYQDYNSISITKTPAIPVTTATPVGIPATTSTTFKLDQIGGYGSPFANNSGCSTENPPANQLTPSGGGTCAGDIRFIQEGTIGFWQKFYQGPKGRLQWGIQYSYVTKSGWSGNNSSPTSTTPGPGISPKAVDNMVWTSFRYYIP